jgi:mono/diheme cytochrome c family protein
MRWFFLILAIASITLALALGPRGEKFSSPPFMLFPDMDNQYKVKAQKPSEFFENGQGAQKPVEGTVPMGYTAPVGDSVATNSLDFSRGSDYYNTGLFGDFYGKGFPEEIKMDEAFLARGKERYQITCTPCHGDSGNGAGVISKYWAIPPTANLIDPRVKAMPEGQIFWTITHGKGLMGPYNGVLSVSDRWAITAYLRGLQAASGN